ncbi:hypothetical protein EV421DRAFT_1744484 [Armillaria borealis]|uniref:Uncharacterized protein n=1 Tax=Armillaria borealis TaxID=47425 RepID=A0AA39IUR6_9AGAR|nr:hypothetical protein EV421DRAFT_1744484 [Armillaria borealis]
MARIPAQFADMKAIFLYKEWLYITCTMRVLFDLIAIKILSLGMAMEMTQQVMTEGLEHQNEQTDTWLLDAHEEGDGQALMESLYPQDLQVHEVKTVRVILMMAMTTMGTPLVFIAASTND